MKLKGLLLFLFFVILVLDAEAQQYNYRHYTTRDGLPSMVVYDVIQDKDGYIWFATSEGVSRFDGYRFKTFTIKDGLPDNDIIGLDNGHDGRVWVVPFQKEAAYIKNDTVYNHPIKGISSNTRGFEVDCNGHLWITTTHGDLYECTDSILRHFDKGNYSDRLSSVLRGSADKKGNVWIGVDDSLIKITGDKVTWYCSTSLYEYKAQSTPFYSPSGQVYLQLLYYICQLRGSELVHVLKVRDLAEDAVINFTNFTHRGDMLVSTSKGAFEVSSKDGNKHIQPFLQGQNVSVTIEDREGNLWFSTLNDGIYMLTTGSRQVMNLNVNNGLPADKPISVFTIDSQLYVSYAYGNLRQLDLSKAGYMFQAPPSHVLHSSLYDCFRLPKEGLWCAGLGGMIIYGSLMPGEKLDLKWFNRSADQPIRGLFDRNKYDLINLGTPKGFTFDGDSLVWMACNDGIVSIDYRSNDKYYVLEERFKERTSAITYEPQQNRVWFASATKLSYFSNDSLYEFSRLKPKSNITTLFIASNGDLIVGTSGEGLFVIRDSVPIVHLDTENGLIGNLVNHILELPNGMLVSTSKGLCLLDKAYNAIPVQFNDGLEGEEIKKTMVYDTTLFVLTNKGVSLVPLTALQPDTLTPLVHISNINIGGKDTAILSSFTLPYNENNIRLEYIGILYKSQGNILYRYQMEGIDTAWIQTSFTNAQYPTLPPGEYTFKVDARSYQGDWSNQPATISITILPPFWQTWWFRALAAIILLAIVTAISYAVIRYYRNQSRIAQRMVELEGQALRANMNPHFVFNALNAIHDFIANQDERSAHLYLGKFAQLIRRILDQSRRNFITLEEELDTLKLYLELENMRFEHKFDFIIKVGATIQPYDTEVPPMLIQPYLENAVRHGLADIGRKGCIQVDFEKHNNHISCTITDNGIGREKAAQVNSKRLKSHRSVGMEITQKRVELLNNPTGGNKADGFTIIDLYDEAGQAAGTQVRLQLPIKEH